MTVLIEGSDWASRAAALAQELVAAGKLTSPEWRKAVLEVPRHVFVPSYYVHCDGGMVAAGATDGQGRAQWLDTVYSNTALITKLAPPYRRCTAGVPVLLQHTRADDPHAGSPRRARRAAGAGDRHSTWARGRPMINYAPSGC